PGPRILRNQRHAAHRPDVRVAQGVCTVREDAGGEVGDDVTELRRPVVTDIARFALVLCTAAVASCHSNPAEHVAASITEFDARMEALGTAAHIPSMSVAIAKDQRIAWSKGYGTPDRSKDDVTADTTVYHFASLTKPFASAILLQLVHEGRI